MDTIGNDEREPGEVTPAEGGDSDQADVHDEQDSDDSEQDDASGDGSD